MSESGIDRLERLLKVIILAPEDQAALIAAARERDDLKAQAESDRAVIEAARMVVGSELLRDTAWTDALKRLNKAIREYDEARDE